MACIDDNGVKKVLKNKEVITYGKDEKADFHYHSVNHTKNGLDLKINHKEKTYNLHSPMLGRFNAENIAASFAMAFTVGIPVEKIVEAISDFKGIKRRFEKRFENKSKTVFDCHAPTPEKAISVLESLKEIYPGKITAIFEPNIGGRQRNSAHMYDNAFKNADMVIIPRLTRLKVSEDKPMEGDELVEVINKTHKNVHYIENDTELVKTAINSGDVIVFLGSHGFRGMIEETITYLHQQSL